MKQENLLKEMLILLFRDIKNLLKWDAKKQEIY